MESFESQDNDLMMEMESFEAQEDGQHSQEGIEYLNLDMGMGTIQVYPPPREANVNDEDFVFVQPDPKANDVTLLGEQLVATGRGSSYRSKKFVSI